jgi:hypothetical protein
MRERQTKPYNKIQCKRCIESENGDKTAHLPVLLWSACTVPASVARIEAKYFPLLMS